jgi:phosphoribosylformimino-5-aminoimidazole carboxamide ribotide isomerase
MKIYPAIDLLNGKCVRLYQGDYQKSEEVAPCPIETAKRFVDDGAKNLHVIDLNGAKGDGNVNFNIIESLAKLPIKVQTGGGIRTLDSIKNALNAGVSRVILGSAAVNNREFLMQALSMYNDKIIVGVDALGDTVRMQGWLDDSGLNYIKFAKELETLGTKNMVFTDISRDGTLEGVNHEAYQNLVNEVKKINVIASGGVKDINDIKRLKTAGAYGVILGKSLYAKTILLKDALVYES